MKQWDYDHLKQTCPKCAWRNEWWLLVENLLWVYFSLRDNNAQVKRLVVTKIKLLQCPWSWWVTSPCLLHGLRFGFVGGWGLVGKLSVTCHNVLVHLQASFQRRSLITNTFLHKLYFVHQLDFLNTSLHKRHCSHQYISM